MHGIIYGWNIDDTGYIYIVNVFEDNLSYILEKLSIKKKKKKIVQDSYYTKFSYKIGCNLKLQPYSINKNINTYFKNIIIEFYVLYALNTNVKFCVNKILFII